MLAPRIPPHRGPTLTNPRSESKPSSLNSKLGGTATERNPQMAQLQGLSRATSASRANQMAAGRAMSKSSRYARKVPILKNHLRHRPFPVARHLDIQWLERRFFPSPGKKRFLVSFRIHYTLTWAGSIGVSGEMSGEEGGAGSRGTSRPATRREMVPQSYSEVFRRYFRISQNDGEGSVIPGRSKSICTLYGGATPVLTWVTWYQHS